MRETALPLQRSPHSLWQYLARSCCTFPLQSVHWDEGEGKVAGHFHTQTHLHSHWVVPVLCSQQLVLANLPASANCRAAACESCPAAAGACLCLGARGNEGALDVAVALQGWGGECVG